MTRKLRALAATLLIGLPLDQVTKLWVEANLPISARWPILDGFFELTHARNPGAAFGLLDGIPASWSGGIFGAATICAVVVVLSFYRRLAPGDQRNAVALGLVLSGALGNFADRLLRGEVIDFLHVRLWVGYEWPDFNLADVFIVAGVAALVLDLLASEAATRAA